jgi:hypothetical protein
MKWWMDARRSLNTYWGKPSIPHAVKVSKEGKK